MEGSTKGVLVVVLIAIAGAVGYYIYEEKKKKSATAAPTLEGGLTAAINTLSDATKPIVDAAKVVAGVATGKTQVALTAANDVLSGDINAAMGKQLWSTSDGSPVYNMTNSVSFKTTKNQFLGIVTGSRPSPTGGFIITFLGTGKATYWITSNGVGIKM